MGMAAGQARLLSITSRMSDNELRAQIINNQKMRLATQSSQVSEAYTTALNNAQMMFTNYDADNNTTYQQLTFNALTAYNPYNNQYAISNASGQVLVSEKDATNYKNANGDLNKFLSYYGLENTTTYFDNLNEYANLDGTIPYSTGSVDDDGNIITASSGLTAEQLQAYYEGIEGSDLHPGYNTTVASTNYYDYTSALSNFDEAYTNWSATIATNMSNYLSGMTANGKNLTAINSDIQSAASTQDMLNVLNNLSEILAEAKNYSIGNTTSKNYFATLEQQIESEKTGKTTYTQDDSYTALIFEGDINNGSLTFGASSEGTIAEDDRIWTIQKTSEPIYQTDASGEYVLDDAGNKILIGYKPPVYSLLSYDYNSDSYTTIIGATINNSGSTISLSFPYEDDEGTQQTVTYEGIPNVLDGYGNTSSYSIVETMPLDLESMKSTAEEIIKSLSSSIYQVWNPALDIFIDTNSPEYTSYIEKGQILSQFLFNRDVGKENYPNLFDTSWVLEQMTEEQKNKFQPILDVLILDSIMNTYGEPKYAWIDKSSVTDSYNENGDAKAQWYTNLFSRMQSGGYQVLQDGLASSSEWIEFAFESGLVTLEQVDSNNNWNTLMYSSCSDITEQTNSAAITIAEAEYNAEMNKIENKDKMYDLELKNIDTEHNSLQTEYDSIKTAIDKNIERTFKIYS